MYCNKCGNKINENDNFCSVCGYKNQMSANSAPEKFDSSAGIIAGISKKQSLFKTIRYIVGFAVLGALIMLVARWAYLQVSFKTSDDNIIDYLAKAAISDQDGNNLPESVKESIRDEIRRRYYYESGAMGAKLSVLSLAMQLN